MNWELNYSSNSNSNSNRYCEFVQKPYRFTNYSIHLCGYKVDKSYFFIHNNTYRLSDLIYKQYIDNLFSLVVHISD